MDRARITKGSELRFVGEVDNGWKRKNESPFSHPQAIFLRMCRKPVKACSFDRVQQNRWGPVERKGPPIDTYPPVLRSPKER